MAEDTTKKETIPPASTTEPKVKEDAIQIPKKTLDAILDRLEAVENESKKDKDTIEMLKGVADKGRLAKWEEQNKGALIRTANVSFWEGMPILAWKKVKDEVGFRDGRLVVNQIIKLFCDDGSKKPLEVDLDYLYWTQNTISMQGDVINKNVSNSGEVWTIELKDGRKVELDIRFINAF